MMNPPKHSQRRAVGPDGPDLRDATRRFRVGDLVTPLWARSGTFVGVVIGVYPALWRVDVDWGIWREKISPDELRPASTVQRPPIQTAVSPSGAATDARKIASRVAAHALKRRGLYWAAPDRKYRATRSEVEAGRYGCPRCGEDLCKATVRKRDGEHEKILACWGCEFLVDPADVVNDPAAQQTSAPFSRLRVE